MSPKRIQMTRNKPWRAEHPDAVIVDRRTKWGNPHRVVRDGGFMWVEPGGKRIVCSTDREGLKREMTAEAVELFRTKWAPLHIDAIRTELAGKDLACWCPLPAEGEPDLCHASVLLDIAAGAM